MAIVIYSFSGLYKKTCKQSIYNATGRKLNQGWIVIISLFRQRIKSLSLQMTYTLNLRVKTGNVDYSTYIKKSVQVKRIILNTPITIGCLVGRVFANGLGDLGSFPGCVIPKTLKMVLDTSLLNIQHYEVCIKGKVEQFRERSSTPPHTHWCCSDWKGSFQVALDYSRQFYFICHSFFSSLARSKYLFLFSFSFVIIIIIYSEFFTSALADGLSLEVKWQQVSSSLQDSFQYSGHSQ